LGYGIATNVARRMLRLPIAWFEKRHIGDVLSRFQSIQPIRQILTEGAVAAVLDGALAIFTLAIMFFYSPALALVALAAFGIYAIVRAATFVAERDAQEETIIAMGKEQSTMIESLRGVGQAALDGAVATVRQHALEPESVLSETFGRRVADQVVTHAKAWPADLIVMGTHGRRGIRRLLMGSDAELVLRTSPVPVLLVRGQPESS
jgi:nucleotide-binding universal stress UspA family protein